MEEKKTIKISLSTLFLILAIIVIIIMGIFIYKLNNDKTTEIKKSTELQTQVNDLNQNVNDLQKKINQISNTINEDTNTSSINADNSSNSQVSSSKTTYVTYSESGIEFKYPSTFEKSEFTLSEDHWIYFTDSDHNDLYIYRENLSSSKTLKDIVEEEKEDNERTDGKIYRTLVKEDENITLASGVKGYKLEFTTIENAYQIMFFTQKDDTTAYKLTFTINDKSEYDDYIEIANEIFDSLTIK